MKVNKATFNAAKRPLHQSSFDEATLLDFRSDTDEIPPTSQQFTEALKRKLLTLRDTCTDVTNEPQVKKGKLHKAYARL